MEVPCRRTLALVGLLLAVSLAGCGGLLDEAPGASPVTTTDAPDGGAGTPASSTPTVDPDNPFGERTLTVAIARPADDPFKETVVRRALAYWENHSEQYAGYPIEYRVVEDGEDPRVRVEFVPEPIECGNTTEEYLVGCAPINVDSAAQTSVVSVGRNYTTGYTEDVLMHELGHTLGLGHEDAPRQYMRPRLPSGILRDSVDVYLTNPNGVATPAQRREVETALEYYADHPALNDSEELDWQFVNTVGAADFVVEFTENDPDCHGDGGGSCSGEAKYLDQDKLVLDDVDTELSAWYVAAYLAPVLLEDDEIPEILEDTPSYDEAAAWDG